MDFDAFIVKRALQFSRKCVSMSTGVHGAPAWIELETSSVSCFYFVSVRPDFNKRQELFVLSFKLELNSSGEETRVNFTSGPTTVTFKTVSSLCVIEGLNLI